MSTNKSVSPSEFRLHTKVFHIDFAPSNYFERIRFEIIFQQLITWFWRQYGIYFFIQKLKLLDEKILIQVYFYKTYLYQESILRTLKFYPTKSTEGTVRNVSDKRTKAVFDWFYMYSPELFVLLHQLKILKPWRIQHRTWTVKKLKPKRKIMLFKSYLKSKRLKHKRVPLRLITYTTTRPQQSILMCNNFFTYFFLHFFKQQSIILAKSIYKVMTANALFKYEHQVVLYRTRFLKWQRWSFDFLFLVNYALTFSNINFVLPFYLSHVVKKYEQFKHAELFFNILRKLYFYKRNIRSIKVLINGPYNRHGRTHARILKIGDLALSQSQSCVMYDAIQWLTPYGAISLKLWVYYSDYLLPR